MDKTDELILGLLQGNGRLSNRMIAKLLELPEKQVANRVRRLLAADDMRILVVADIFAAGFEFMLFVGIEVADRPADQVARELAQFPEVISVMLTMGSGDIELVMVAEDHAALVTLANERLSRIEGIRRYSISLGLQVFKYLTTMGPLLNTDQAPMGIPNNGPLDRTDREVIAMLWDDTRATNQRLADKLGMSESAVRARIQSLRERNIIHITAMRNMRIEQGQVFASIGVEVAGRSVDAVARELTELEDTGFVAKVLGRYDILVMGLLGSARELSQLLSSRIERLDGVRKVHTSQVLSFVKYDHHWTAILAPEEN